MNILLLGTPRSKSSIFAEVLSRKYDAYIYSEPFLMVDNHHITDSKLSKKQFITEVMKVFNKKLSHQNKNQIIKLHCGNLGGLIQYIDDLNIGMYDHVYMIERYDFFEQACSVLTAQINHNWTNTLISRQKDYSNNKNYTLDKNVIEYLMFEVREYLKIKKYLLDNKIPFTLEKYENLPKSISSNRTKPSLVEYSKTISNYHIKDEINSCFFKHFNYDSCHHDSAGFLKDIDKITF